MTICVLHIYICMYIIGVLYIIKCKGKLCVAVEYIHAVIFIWNYQYNPYICRSIFIGTYYYAILCMSM